MLCDKITFRKLFNMSWYIDSLCQAFEGRASDAELEDIKSEASEVLKGHDYATSDGKIVKHRCVLQCIGLKNKICFKK